MCMGYYHSIKKRKNFIRYQTSCKMMTLGCFVHPNKQCKDFDHYKDQFKAVHQDIREGKRKLLEFHDTDEQLVSGKYYVLNGVLLLLEKVNIDDARKRKDGRTRCIFENGTESDMLYRSLSKSLYNDGKMVSETNEEATSNFYRSMGGITEEDQKTGYIYVLRSLSQRPEIKSIDNLYKIGLSTTSVAERITNAKNETTYLMADVEIVAEYEAYGINVLAFEQNIHRLFAASCLDVEIVGSDGAKHKPREWFIAPLEVINQAIELTVNRQVHHYRYDRNQNILLLN
jgi:hypothetical protein